MPSPKKTDNAGDIDQIMDFDVVKNQRKSVGGLALDKKIRI